MRVVFGLALGVFTAAVTVPAIAQQPNNMTFFITSVGPGKGADLGGLAGADQYCTTLAQAAGSTGKTWHAYLSTQAAEGKPAVNARDRIGKGPWQNIKGVVIAKDVEQLHTFNAIDKASALTEKGERVNGWGDQPIRHDILTGSQPDGTAYADTADHTCKNWTSSTDGSAMLGHSDVSGPVASPGNISSWNNAHPSRGCSQDGLKSTGGDGLLYCFATN